jgi:hypothetical protein
MDPFNQCAANAVNESLSSRLAAFPIEIGLDISTPVSVSLADETRFSIRSLGQAPLLTAIEWLQ